MCLKIIYKGTLAAALIIVLLMTVPLAIAEETAVPTELAELVCHYTTWSDASLTKLFSTSALHETEPTFIGRENGVAYYDDGSSLLSFATGNVQLETEKFQCVYNVLFTETQVSQSILYNDVSPYTLPDVILDFWAAAGTAACVSSIPYVVYAWDQAALDAYIPTLLEMGETISNEAFADCVRAAKPFSCAFYQVSMEGVPICSDTFFTPSGNLIIGTNLQLLIAEDRIQFMYTGNTLIDHTEARKKSPVISREQAEAALISMFNSLFLPEALTITQGELCYLPADETASSVTLIPVWLFHTNMDVHAVHALTGKTMF